ncbi:MAG: geranylgeranyl reductase family protein [Micrococcaceae bacterium]
MKDFDVVVIGAGPAGSTASYYLADAGLNVALLEKSSFPREKVCGDGLTPRAVHEMQLMNLPHDGKGWKRTKGLKIVANKRSVEYPWPQGDFPSYGLISTRYTFDHTLVQHAVKAGAHLYENHSFAELIEDKTGRVSGVKASILDERGRKTGESATFNAPIVLACDGVSSRTALARGLEKRDDRPMGVAVRAYYESPMTNDPWMQGWLELNTPESNKLLPGYGWIFGLGDGTCNVGLGILNSSQEFGKIDYKKVLNEWVSGLDPAWEFTPETMQGKMMSAALPMGFNRTPHYDSGLLLLGDAGGMVSPFNGEGISYAMESARYAAARVVQAHGSPRQDAILQQYTQDLAQAWGAHFSQGRLMAELIGKPQVMKAAVRAGIRTPALMRLVVKTMANLSNTQDQHLDDRVIKLLEQLTPKAGV